MMYLRNIAQIGGVYLQAYAVGDFLIASRIGGLQLFLIDAGTLIPSSTLPLAAVPYLVLRNDDLFAVFKKSAYKIQITSEREIKLHAVSIDAIYQRPLETNQQVITPHGTFQLDRKAGTFTNLTTTKTTKLPGYSRPSTISASQSGEFLYISDVGRIHCFHIAQEAFTQGYSNPGWPKDVCVAGDNVFVANVYGVTWYKDLNDAPFLKMQSKVNFPHFRIAKVITRDQYVYAGDEARGVHIFKADSSGKLLPKGGIMCDGGGWDCTFVEDDLYIANGEKGWCRLKNFSPDKTIYSPDLKIVYENERVQAVSDWPNANAVVILSSGYTRVLSKDENTELFSFCANSWAGCAAGKLFFAATATGIVVLKVDDHGKIIISEQIETTEARDICYDSKYIWIADGKGGIKCFSVDSNVVKYVGTFPVCGFSRGLFVSERRLYVGAGDGGLAVIEKR